MSDFRARSNAEILDAAFELYRRYFSFYFAISVVVCIPSAASTYLARTQLATDPLTGSFIAAAASVVGALVAPFTDGAIAALTSAAYLGATVDISDSVRAAFAHPWQLFSAWWTKALMMGFGFLLFIFPAFIVFKRYFAIVPIVVLEKRPAGSAIKRSRELSQGAGGRIFALLGGVLVFATVVSLMLNGLAASLHIAALSSLVYLIVVAAIYPFGAIVTTLLYYDTRIRREGYDIELLANALDASEAPNSAPLLNANI